MDDVARLPAADRADLFRAAAAARGLGEQIIEKDFWVCWTLRRLFTLPSPPAPILFKGGTSLSKAYQAIERFSEDIDLVLDRHGLGFEGDRDPGQPDMSRKKRQALIRELREACQAGVRGPMLAMLTESIASELGDTPGAVWTLTAANDDADDQTLLFEYPVTDPDARKRSGYIKPVIRLEFGARGDHWPAEWRPIVPYAAESVPGAFASPETSVTTLAAERTFWEKATALHMMHHMPKDRRLGPRQSRHYSDLHQLAGRAVGSRALSNRDLLGQVAAHKQAFFPAAWARYEEAPTGQLRLAPPEHRLKALQKDYKAMGEMFFSEKVPSFDEIVARLQELERKINAEMPSDAARSGSPGGIDHKPHRS
jgi:hypothetical protein